MTRFGLGILVAASTAAAFAMVACGEDAIDDGVAGASDGGGAGGGGAGGGGAGGATGGGGSGTGSGAGTGGAPASDKCEGACCPEQKSCYSDPAVGNGSPGSECMARRDNTGTKRIQMRQTWIRPSAPKGNTIPLVYGALNTYSQLREPGCYSPNGTSGYIQLNDFDLDAGISRVGYAKFLPEANVAAGPTDGLCMVAEDAWTMKATVGGTERDFSIAAADLPSHADLGWPTGVPGPMAQPWKIAPTRAKRLDADFTLPADREALLARLDPATGDLGKENFTGVFYFNEETGYAHGFGTVNYLVIYDGTPDNFIVVPIREPETKSTFNNPKSPNCVGVFRGDALNPDTGCLPSNADPTANDYFAWTGPDGKLGEGPATVNGYFYIPELEQVYSAVLQSTLCVSYPTFDDSKTAGWATDTDRSCRSNPAFDPKNPTAGLPMGDWCAKTNSAATADCHDSYRSTSFHAFQAYKIKDETCTAK